MFKNTKAFSGFSVNDLAAAKKFYGDTLGINVVESPMGLELHVAGSTPIYVYAKPDHTPATFTILNFPVDNIDRAVDELVKKGIHFEQYGSPDMPQDAKGVDRGVDAGMGPNIAWFKDPAGNVLSILADK